MSRRIEDQGRGAPAVIASAPPVTASFNGPCHEKQRADGWIESERDLSIHLPPSDTGGTHTGEFTLKWSSGDELKHVLAGRVTPRIRVSPSGVVLLADGGRLQQTAELRSEDCPFRITDVECPLLDPAASTAPAGADNTHRLVVSLDPERAPRDGAFDLRITTDHPAQTALTLTIIVVSDRGGER